MAWFTHRRGQPVASAAPVKARLGLEELGPRWVPDATPVLPIPQPIDALVGTPATLVDTTTITLDFSKLTTNGGKTADADTVTIKIVPAGGITTTLTIDVPTGTAPAAIATAVAANLRENGFKTAIANGGVVTFTVNADATSSTVSHINNNNGDPTIEPILVKTKN